MTGVETRRGPDLNAEFLDRLVKNPNEIIANIAVLFDVRDPNGYLEQLRVEIANGKIPVLVANHQSLSDGIALSTVTAQLPKPFRLPISASIEKGQQGDVVQLLLEFMGPALERRNLIMLPLVTDADVKKRSMSRTPNKVNLGK